MRSVGEHGVEVRLLRAVCPDVYEIIAIQNGYSGFLHRSELVLESDEDEQQVAEADSALRRRQN